MISRKLNTLIDRFYENNRMALMLTGARQVGKTFAFRHFAERHFENYIEINFIKNPDAVSIFDGVHSADEILLRISAFTSVKMEAGKTFILFDEVQKCPECVTQIKFLVEDGRYTYGMTGSLLGVELKSLRSEPVGYMDVAEVFPLDFEEFALAIGVAPSIIESLREAYTARMPADPVVHKQMLSVFQLYLIVGGMPAAVQKYIETHNMQGVAAQQRAILHLYKRDIAQYDPDRKLYLDDIFDLIPSELNAKNKRFILKTLNKHAKYTRYEDSFLWLKNAGAAIPVFNVEEPRIPLLLNKQRNLFKLFQNDVGLLAAQYANGIQLKILSGEVNINFGAVYENAVAQEFLAHGFGNLYYFNSKKQGELDFLAEPGDGSVLPIEVKSGKDYSVHDALDNVLANKAYNIPCALVLCNENLHVKGKVVYLPIYMTMFIHREEEVLSEYRPDISMLMGIE